MAAIRSRRRSGAPSGNSRRVTSSVRLPDIWIAVPSRPAEPPKRWVTIVAPYTSGAIRRGIHAAGVWISSMIRLLPAAAVPARCRYTTPSTSPAIGSRNSNQPCATRVSVAHASVSRNSADDTPASTPTTPPSRARRAVCTVASTVRATRAICHLLGGPAGGERLPTGPCDPSGRSHQPEGGCGELHRLAAEYQPVTPAGSRGVPAVAGIAEYLRPRLGP